MIEGRSDQFTPDRVDTVGSQLAEQALVEMDHSESPRTDSPMDNSKLQLPGVNIDKRDLNDDLTHLPDSEPDSSKSSPSSILKDLEKTTREIGDKPKPTTDDASANPADFLELLKRSITRDGESLLLQEVLRDNPTLKQLEEFSKDPRGARTFGEYLKNEELRRPATVDTASSDAETRRRARDILKETKGYETGIIVGNTTGNTNIEQRSTMSDTHSTENFNFRPPAGEEDREKGGLSVPSDSGKQEKNRTAADIVGEKSAEQNVDKTSENAPGKLAETPKAQPEELRRVTDSVPYASKYRIPSESLEKSLSPESLKKFEEIKKALLSADNPDSLVKAIHSLNGNPDSEKILKAIVQSAKKEGLSASYSYDKNSEPPVAKLKLGSGNGRYSIDMSSKPDSKPVAQEHQINWKKIGDKYDPNWTVNSVDVSIATAWKAVQDKRIGDNSKDPAKPQEAKRQDFVQFAGGLTEQLKTPAELKRIIEDNKPKTESSTDKTGNVTKFKDGNSAVEFEHDPGNAGELSKVTITKRDEKTGKLSTEIFEKKESGLVFHTVNGKTTALDLRTASIKLTDEGFKIQNDRGKVVDQRKIPGVDTDLAWQKQMIKVKHDPQMTPG